MGLLEELIDFEILGGFDKTSGDNSDDDLEKELLIDEAEELLQLQVKME